MHRYQVLDAKFAYLHIVLLKIDTKASTKSSVTCPSHISSRQMSFFTVNVLVLLCDAFFYHTAFLR